MDCGRIDRLATAAGSGSRRAALRALAGVGLAGPLGRPRAGAAACAGLGKRCGDPRACCAGARCRRGRCRCAGRRPTACFGACVPLGTATDCAGCGDACAAGETCLGGRCAPYAFVAAWGRRGTGDGEFLGPWALGLGPDGHLYVADDDRIHKFTADGAFVLTWGGLGGGDGQFQLPRSVAVDGDGYVYVADEHHRVQKFTGEQGHGDGGFVTAWGRLGQGEGEFDGPSGLAVDADGHVYVADYYNHRVQAFTGAGTFLAQWGGAGGGGPVRYPTSVAVGADGHVFVAEAGTPSGTPPGDHRIQEFAADGGFVTAWGSFGRGDGQFRFPRGVAVDGQGNVYVADTNNDRVQKFAPVA